MKAQKAISVIFALVFGLAIFMAAARADVWEDQQTRLTFSKPVRVSENVVLPAGTYWFRLADSMSSPFDIVEILDKNETHIAMVMTKPTEREMPRYGATTKAEWTENKLNFVEGSGQDTLMKWFYPGERLGHEFMYSGQRENDLSQEQILTVMVPR